MGSETLEFDPPWPDDHEKRCPASRVTVSTGHRLSAGRISRFPSPFRDEIFDQNFYLAPSFKVEWIVCSFRSSLFGVFRRASCWKNHEFYVKALLLVGKIMISVLLVGKSRFLCQNRFS